MSNLVKDMMARDVYVAHESNNVSEVLKLMADYSIGGVPVINDDKEVVGFISDGDIMKFISRQDPRIIDMTSFVSVWYDIETFDDKLFDLLQINVMELAARRVVTAEPDEVIEDAARVLARKKLKKLPVVKDGVIVGVLSRKMIVKYIVNEFLTERSEEV